MIINAALRRLRKAVGLTARYLRGLGPPTPVIVYQMGKVGSRSVGDSLRQYALAPVFHVHRMNPRNIERVRQEYRQHNETPLREDLGKRLYRNIVQPAKSARVITLVREPISRNMSAFFQNLKRFTGSEYGDGGFTVQELTNLFISSYTHPVPLAWFDVEMKQTLSIDVYNHPFPRERGHMTIAKGNFELLILKLEIDDARKESAIAEFLGLEDFKLTRANVGQAKDYAQTYRDFLRTIRLPRMYVELMCSAEYTRHFYTAAEIDAVRAEWQDRVTAVDLPPAVYTELVRAAARSGD